MLALENKVDDLDLTLVFLHVHCDELIANFRGVFSTVHVTERFLLQLGNLFLQLRVVFFALPPADLVQAFSEEDDEGKDCLVELVVHFLGDVVEIEGENFIHVHLQLLVLCQIVVVSLPLQGLPVFGGLGLLLVI